MASIAKLVVSLGANTSHFETDMKRAAKISDRQLKRMEFQAKRLNEKWNRHFKRAGLAVAGGLALAAKAAIDFENAMAEVSTLLDDTSGMDNLRESVKDLSVEFGQAPVTQAKALYQIISAGASEAADQTELLTAANKLAVGGVTDVATAAGGLTTVWNAYKSEGLGAAEITDIMFTTMRNGKTTIEELSSSIGNVAAIAQAAGVGFDEVGAAVGTLSKVFPSTQQAVDGLRGVLNALLKQSQQTVAAAKDIGIEFDTAALRSKGLLGVMQDLANSGATETQMAKLLGRVEALNATFVLTSDGGAEFSRQLKTVEKSAGAADVAVAKMADEAQFKINQAKAAFQRLGIEVGGKFLATISSTAQAMVKHIDAIAAAVEALVILLTIRLGVMGVKAMLSVTAASSGMAVAMAALGGPIGAVALAFGALLLAIDHYVEKQLDAIVETPKLTGMLIKQAEAFRKVGDNAALAALAVDIGDKYKKLGKEVTDSTNAVIAANKAYLLSANLSGENSQRTIQLREELEKLELHALNVRKAFRAYGKELEKITEETEDSAEAAEGAAKGIDQTAKAAEGAAKSTKGLTDSSKKAAAALLGMSGVMDAQREIIQELKREQEEYERSLQGILDTVFPVEAAGRELGDTLALLTRGYDDGKISAEQYEEAVRSLTESFNDEVKGIRNVTDEFNLMKVAIDEGVRILERTFTSLWENLLSGSKNAFDSVADGFKAMLANLAHHAITQPIILNIQQGLAGTGTGPGGGINFTQLGNQLSTFAAVIAGSALGGGQQWANIGAVIGTVAGKYFGNMLLPGIGGIIGQFLGSALGGLFGGLFDKKKTPRIGAGGFDIEPGDTKFFDTALGGVFVGDTKGGMDDFVAEFGDALADFDRTIASFLGDDQLGAITDALKLWRTELSGDAISIEALIGSRFRTILGTFGDSIQEFVNRGSDLTAQVERLQVGVTAEALFTDNEGLFSGRTVSDILTVVEAMRTGSQTIGQAYNAFLELLNVVVAVKASLEDFANSNLAEDFQTLIDSANISLTEALTGMTSALSDAILNFDGSPEQLQSIGLMVSSVREGEIKLLAQIDAIQQGIQANLATLKADLLGLAEGPKTDEQLFKDAQGFINSISSAAGAEEIAALERQFNEVIRAMSPESQMSNMGSILAMIDAFSSEADTALAAMSQAVIDSGASTRAMIEEFIIRVGDPLDLIAGTNEEIRDALSLESGTQAQNEIHQDNVEGILEAGVDDIADEVANIGPVVANALRSAMGGVNLNVTVVPSRRGLTNE